MRPKLWQPQSRFYSFSQGIPFLFFYLYYRV
jgi:hypothetical protein